MLPWSNYNLKYALTFALGLVTASSYLGAFEDTKVLPKGVRNFTIRTVDTKLDKKNDAEGDHVNLGDPIQKGLTFEKIIAGEEGSLKGLALVGMQSTGFEEDDSLGTYTADLKAHVRVVAPVFAYGLTDRLTLAIAVPYYQAATNVAVGFKTNETGELFLQALQNRQLTAAAVETVSKLNNAIGELQNKLMENGYEPLGDWQKSGYGDTTLAAKYLAFDGDAFDVATTFGVVAPTGRLDNPNILTDIPFGDGTWDAFLQASFDYSFAQGWLLNYYSKYLYQFESERDIRLVTEVESIKGPLEKVNYKMGDIWTTGLSAQWEPDFGLVSGVGLDYLRKFGDRYYVEDPDVDARYRQETYHESVRNTYMLGYSTIPAFRRKAFAAPLKATLVYSRVADSVSNPTNDIYQFDVKLFF